ncbi:MAG: twin-arginine translocase TatA/TatE family subunit [Anaerolineae bacterium]
MPRFIGGWEWIIILVIVVIIFGVGRLPEIGGALGRSIREFRMNVEKGKQEDASAKEKAEASESKEAEG